MKSRTQENRREKEKNGEKNRKQERTGGTKQIRRKQEKTLENTR